MFKGTVRETVILTLLHLRGPTGLGDSLTFTVLHLEEAVASATDRSTGEAMENHIHDGKRHVCLWCFYISLELEMVPAALYKDEALLVHLLVVQWSCRRIIGNKSCIFMNLLAIKTCH